MAVTSTGRPYPFGKRARNPQPHELPPEVLAHLAANGFGVAAVTDATENAQLEWVRTPSGMKEMEVSYLKVYVTGCRKPFVFRAKKNGGYTPSNRKNIVL